ncbi:hypothetical protein MA16_Dca006282 [Dendrobium catenatum]|uniref:Uncharacterized protein n=1 Tax=Dendrobium catenatum TaxID=906689 RepID=A0A2I0W9E8_9ASPA|nr:hypothetical protein MA16_Dca006282 [Dendrobium catenatum]
MIPLVNGLPQTSSTPKSQGDTSFINVPIIVMSNDDLMTHTAEFRNNSVCLQTDWLILDDFSSSLFEREDVEFEEEVVASRIVEKSCSNVAGKKGISKGKK